MISRQIVTENQLDEWVRGNARIAHGVVVELVWRLVAASSPRPKERRFPLGDSIGQPGPDGILDTDFGFDPFVPEGKSFWEIGTGIDANPNGVPGTPYLTLDAGLWSGQFPTMARLARVIAPGMPHHVT